MTTCEQYVEYPLNIFTHLPSATYAQWFESSRTVSSINHKYHTHYIKYKKREEKPNKISNNNNHKMMPKSFYPLTEFNERK